MAGYIWFGVHVCVCVCEKKLIMENDFQSFVFTFLLPIQSISYIIFNHFNQLICCCCLYTINKIHVLSVFLSSIVIGLTFFGHRRAEKMMMKKKNQRIASQNVVVIIVVVVAPFEFCFSFIIKKHNKITFTSWFSLNSTRIRVYRGIEQTCVCACHVKGWHNVWKSKIWEQ